MNIGKWIFISILVFWSLVLCAVSFHLVKFEASLDNKVNEKEIILIEDLKIQSKNKIADIELIAPYFSENGKMSLMVDFYKFNGQKSSKEELIKELIDLSKTYGIIAYKDMGMNKKKELMLYKDKMKELEKRYTGIFNSVESMNSQYNLIKTGEGEVYLKDLGDKVEGIDLENIDYILDYGDYSNSGLYLYGRKIQIKKNVFE